MIPVRYDVGGRPFVGLFGDQRRDASSSLALVVGAAADHPAGREVPVWYDPAAPSRFVLTAAQRLRVGRAVLGAGSLLVAILLASWGTR